MDDVYAYFTRLPDGVHEIVAPCADGYTVYIDDTLDDDARRDAYYHAVSHIHAHDWTRDDVQAIEHDAHRRIYGDTEKITLWPMESARVL